MHLYLALCVFVVCTFSIYFSLSASTKKSSNRIKFLLKTGEPVEMNYSKLGCHKKILLVISGTVHSFGVPRYRTHLLKGFYTGGYDLVAQ